ncbi:hypothetical protein CRYUN_Cryun01aG0229200 [Craigia yunnanensis]
MNPQADKLVRRTTMVATVTASYFLLTADYGPEPNVLDPVSLFYSFSIVLVSKSELWIFIYICSLIEDGGII